VRDAIYVPVLLGVVFILHANLFLKKNLSAETGFLLVGDVDDGGGDRVVLEPVPVDRAEERV